MSGTSRGAHSISPVFPLPNPFPPSTGPNAPRFNTCMRSPWIVFWKQYPAEPTTCGWDQVMRVGHMGPAFPLLLFPSSPGLDRTLTSMAVFMR